MKTSPAIAALPAQHLFPPVTGTQCGLLYSLCLPCGSREFPLPPSLPRRFSTLSSENGRVGEEKGLWSQLAEAKKGLPASCPASPPVDS